MGKELNILAISYAKRTLQEGSRENLRMQVYANTVDAFTIIVFTCRKDNLPQKYVKGNLVIYGTNTRTRLGALCRSYYLGRKILKENSAKRWVISAQDPFATGCAAQALSHLRNTSLHIQLHGDPFSKVTNKSFVQKVLNLYGAYLLRKVDAVRVVSKRAQYSVVTLGVSQKKITILPIQQGLTDFLKVGQCRTYVQKNSTTFLYIGRLSPEKNIKRIINCFAEACQKDTTLRLRIVGEGTCDESLRNLVEMKKLKNVIVFIPWTDSVHEEMKKADILVCASLHEGYGMVLIEAMAAGLPIITTDVGCVGDVLTGGQSGLVISQKNDDEYTSVFLTLSKDMLLQERLGKTAYQTIKHTQVTQQEYLQQWRDSFVVR